LQRRPRPRQISPTSAHASVGSLPACPTPAPRSPRTAHSTCPVHNHRPLSHLRPRPASHTLGPQHVLTARQCPTEWRASRRPGLGHYSLLAARAVAGVTASRGRGRHAGRSAATRRRRVHPRRERRGGRGVPRGWRWLGVPAVRVRRARCFRRLASWCGVRVGAAADGGLYGAGWWCERCRLPRKSIH
jgi:hypothetical protein